jgi:DNA primase
MSITPDFLDELRLRLPVSEVVGKRVSLTRHGREYTGLCPFHKEKSPSFTVSDEKGFYHCFGCGAHGDVVRFVMETEALAFPDAVEKLAGLAGLPPPPRGPRDAEKEEKRATLHDVLEAAAGWYESQLAAAVGSTARDYLKGRGLTPETIGEFRLGFAPDRNSGLKDALLARQFTEAQMLEAGLLVEPEGGGETRDKFRGRVMFPITDPRGRVVAFGGRAMGDGKPKYLNSPETPLFRKGHLLYNLARARPKARDAGTIIVVEGYMDVIALDQAGLGYAVAPLGTALTEDQLKLLWRVAPEPVLCFDGDAAGTRAAHRAMERALPMLAPGISLRFAFLPSGEDPDTLVRRNGPEAMTGLLKSARPLTDVLWDARFSAVAADTPERRAGLEREIGKVVSEIRDPKIRDYYRADLNARLAERLNAGRRTQLGGGMGGSAPLRPRDKFQSYRSYGASREMTQQFAAQGSRPNFVIREKLLVLTVVNHPEILGRYSEDFMSIDFSTPDLDKLRAEILGIAAHSSALDTGAVRRHFQQRGLGGLLGWLEGQESLKNEWFAWPGAAIEDVERGWLHVLSRHRKARTLRSELDRATKALAADMTDEAYERFLAVKAEMDALEGDEASLEGYGVPSGREASI